MGCFPLPPSQAPGASTVLPQASVPAAPPAPFASTVLPPLPVPLLQPLHVVRRLSSQRPAGFLGEGLSAPGRTASPLGPQRLDDEGLAASCRHRPSRGCNGWPRTSWSTRLTWRLTTWRRPPSRQGPTDDRQQLSLLLPLPGPRRLQHLEPPALSPPPWGRRSLPGAHRDLSSARIFPSLHHPAPSFLPKMFSALLNLITFSHLALPTRLFAACHPPVPPKSPGAPTGPKKQADKGVGGAGAAQRRAGRATGSEWWKSVPQGWDADEPNRARGLRISRCGGGNRLPIV